MPGRLLTRSTSFGGHSRSRSVRLVCVGIVAAAVMASGAGGRTTGGPAAAASFPAPPADYMVSLPCSETSGLAIGSICSQHDAQIPFVSPAQHPDVFELSAEAESSPPGTLLRVEFFNAGCAESPAISVSVQPFTRASASAAPVASGPARAVGTLAPAAPGHWAERALFKMPELGQTTARRYPTRHAQVELSFSGRIAKCQFAGGLSTIVHGYFEVRHATAPPPCAAGTRTTASASATPSPCPVSVSITRLTPSLAGLSYIGRTAGTNTAAAMTNSAAFVRELGTPAEVGSSGHLLDGCVSGCIDFLVTVTNKSGPVEGAAVHASVTPIASPIAGGGGFLCGETVATSEPTSLFCGANGFHDVDDLSTNADGQVLVRYWLPALASEATVSLTARATAPGGCAGGCPITRTNPRTIAVKVEPHLLLTAEAPMPSDVVAQIAGWANPATALEIGGQGPIVAATNAVKSMITEEQGRQQLISDVPALKWTTTLANAVAGMSKAKQQKTLLMLLLMGRLKVQGLGLYDQSDSAQDPKELVTDDFLDLIANSSLENRGQEALLAFLPITVAPLGTSWSDKAGLLWDWGRYAKANQLDHSDWKAQLKVWDLSYCVQTREIAEPATACGTGYGDGARRRDGIQPLIYLSFHLSLDDPNLKRSFTRSFVIPYNASAWMQEQFGNQSR